MIKIYEKKNLRGHALNLYKDNLQKKGLTQIQKDILIGTLLGDASMQAMKENEQSNVKFEQQIKQADYINHLYEEFQEWVGTPPQVRNITGGGANDRQSIWFRTYRHPSFTFYKNIFYKVDKDGKQYKVVPKLIHRWLTPRALAYWFMDDGSFSNNSLNLHTQGFKVKDVEKLRNALNKNFSIQSNLHKDRGSYKLYILKESHENFKKIMQGCVHPCFLYKIHSPDENLKKMGGI